MIAAMMTAANLGARITGWGFVVFTIGSLCWAAIGIASGQTNLLATNVFLTLVNLIGIWRWLGRQRAYEDGGKSAETASRASAAPSLFAATGIVGVPVEDCEGAALGKAVEALVECDTGRVSYVVIASRRPDALTEELRAVGRDAIRFGSDVLVVSLSADAFHALPPLEAGAWPERPPSSGPSGGV
jgi:hypothetical protein